MTTGRRAPRQPRTTQRGTVTSSYSLRQDAHEAISAYAQAHQMSRSAATSALVLYGVAWQQERKAKRSQ